MNKIIVKDQEFIVPTWILDDVGYFYEEIYNWIIKEKDDYVIFNICHLNKFKQLRKQIYWLCHWYDELIEANIPVIKSDVYDVTNLDILHDILHEEKFIRLCNASPKDISSCLFNGNIDSIIDIFKTSARTSYMLESDHIHLVLRPVVKMDHELRCFWHKHQLRAVSGPEYYIENTESIKNKIILFFDTYGKDIIYNSAVIDIAIHLDNVFIIEFNSFGSDMLAGVGHFKWDEPLLYHADKPVFRFKSKYQW